MLYNDHEIPQQVEELLLNNAPPPDALTPTVNGLLEASRSQLSTIQGEMDELAKLLVTVKQRFEATQQSITKYETILSPIRRVPADILGEIFGHCLPTHRNPLFLSSEAPILPSHVCRSWRAAALSTPSLWARLHVSFPGVAPELEGESPDVLSNGTTHTNSTLALYPRIMKRRSDAVKEWLARSGASPLSLSILSYTTFPEYLAEIIHSATEMVLDVIAPSCDRWREIELTMPLDLYQKFEAKFASNKFLSLRHTRMSLDGPVYKLFGGDNIPSPPSIALLSARNLEGVFLSLPVVEAFNFSYLDKHNGMAPIWGQLTRLFLHTMISDRDLPPFLRACPRLVNCGLSTYASSHEHQLAPTVISDFQDGKDICLPHLQTFKITDAGSPSIMGNIFALFSVPELNRIDYWRFHPYFDNHSGYRAPPLVLLEAARSITSFHFDPQGLSHDSTLQCLQTIPNLRHLTIGGRPTPHKPEGMPINRRAPSFRSTTFPLEDLVPREDAQLNGTGDILLPSLESFEICEPFDHISDSTLQKFICSRVGLAAARRGISPLKRIKGHFERPMQEDISKEVKRCAAEAGVKVDLDLTYLPEHLETKNPFSVEFGLTQITRRTWIYSVLES
ncbi:hypothetical protein NLJ89_g8805 [Agrocybe chaxingu]|uniref:F-box domain-containing protein n=1 Tax=Agrocybe chaxingu TaxID=84603 RepID=A0A9W8JTZ0_9AGAR|nr:hypothetical protein NLJ89_g8805 [Agrocybe chaxingu]